MLFFAFIVISAIFDFKSYQKVTQNFYSLLECIAHDNIAYLSNVQPELFITLLRYIQRGTVSLDGLVVSVIRICYF